MRQIELAVGLAVTLLALAIVHPAFGADVSVRAELDRDSAAPGDAVALTITVEGTQSAPAPMLTAPDGLTIRYLGPSTQISFVNGQMSASIGHRYAVRAEKAGTYSIGPFHIAVGGQDYTAAAVQLTVGGNPPARGAAPGAAGGGAPGANDLNLSIEVPKSAAYVGERIPITIVLTVGNVRVDDLQYPTVEGDAFAMDKLPEPAQNDEVRGGRRVHVLRFPTAVVALRPGSVSLGPAHMSMSMVVPRRGGVNDPFFGRFFNDADRRPVDLKADAVPLEIRGLPSEGRPADFAGAVGSFDFNIDAQPTEVNVGDPITLRTHITGNGNFNTVEAPTLSAGSDFKLYAAQASGERSPTARSFEQVVIPLRAQVREIPPLRFTFFDPGSERYVTVTKGPIAVTVRPAAQQDAPKRVEAPGVERATPAEKLGRDIVFIKDAPGTLTARGYRFYRAPWFLLLQLLPLLAYASTWWFARRRERLHADPRYARFLRAGRDARTALGEAERVLRSGDAAQFTDLLARAVREYLAAKLDLPPGAVEPQRIAERVGRNGGTPDVLPRVEQLLTLLEGVRYAPRMQAAGDGDRALQLAREIVEAFERRGSRWMRAGAAAAILLSVGMAAAANPNAAFYEGNTAYSAGHYGEAAASYEAVLGSGVESPALYFNLGNAYMKDGKPGRAILDYERARRLAPRDPDIRTNLQFAREEQDAVTEIPLWERLAFPGGAHLSLAELAALTSALYAALMLALCARALWPQWTAGVNRAAVAIALALVVAGSGLIYRAVRDDRRAAVVVESGQVAVRFEPSADGTTHFIAKEGTLLHVAEERDDWVQVVRADGRRGWLERGAVELVEPQ